MDDLSRFCCQNPKCSLYGQRDAGYLSVRDRYGKHQQIRLLYCNACKSRFSERKGTPLSQSCLPPEKVVSVPQHLVERNRVRQTERLVGVHRDTVMRLARMAGEHTRNTYDELVSFSP
jgi:transposase-like protein